MRIGSQQRTRLVLLEILSLVDQESLRVIFPDWFCFIGDARNDGSADV